jgi:hypothetical protein
MAINSVATMRVDIIKKLIASWEQEGRVITSAQEYKALENPPVNFQLIRKYIGSYNRAVRWAHRWFPSRVSKIEGGSVPPPYIPSASETDQPKIEPVVVETTESDTPTIPSFWAESEEEPKDE